AKAYLEKSHALKESGKTGWKPLLVKGYDIGKRFFVVERYNPELIYILGKSLYINNRREKAIRYGKKAIKLSGYNLKYSEYFLLVGDSYSALAGPSGSSVTSTPAGNNDTSAVKYYKYVINGFKGAKADDSSRALAYYRLAVHYSESGRKTKAKESLEAALQLSPVESLSSQIHALLNKL
nr:tetratricopeptide repeat protein [Candidatus Aenigmarchaeota archaeon]